MKRKQEFILGLLGLIALVFIMLTKGFSLLMAYSGLMGLIGLGLIGLNKNVKFSSALLLCVGAFNLVVLNSILVGILFVVAGVIGLVRKN